jgi:hypothetical protein
MALRVFGRHNALDVYGGSGANDVHVASVWYAPSQTGVKRHVVALERAQRLASRLILRAYKSVAMLVLQSEAKLQSVSNRLHERVLNY